MYEARVYTPRFLSDQMAIAPNIKTENVTWTRRGATKPWEVSALDDYNYPYIRVGVNEYIYSAPTIRNILNCRTSASDHHLRNLADFLSTNVDNCGHTQESETTLEKFIRFFKPYGIAISKVSEDYSAEIACQGRRTMCLYTGSNSIKSAEPRGHGVDVQTDLRIPCAHFSNYHRMDGTDGGLFAIFDTDPYALGINETKHASYRVRYALTHSADLKAVCERVLLSNNGISDGNIRHDPYGYEIAIRKIATIERCNHKTISIGFQTVKLLEYVVDYSSEWHYRHRELYADNFDENTN